MSKSIIKLQVDEMLSRKASFKEIMQVTGWSEEEIWMYMDMVFRTNNPEFGKSNRHYCVWGISDDKSLDKTLVKKR